MSTIHARSVAVLAPGGRLYVGDQGGGRAVYQAGSPSLASLASAAGRRGVRSIWIAPHALPAVADPAWWAVPDSHYAFLVTSAGARYPTGANVRDKTIPGGECQIIDYGRDTRWPWPSGNPSVALDTILWLEAQLGVGVSWGPASVGWALVEGVSRGHLGWLIRPDGLNDWPQTADLAPTYLRSILPVEAGRWLHAFDANAAYLAAAQTVRLGVGEPTRSAEFGPKSVGVWPVHVKRSGSKRSGPAPIEHDGTYDAATIRAAQAAGLELSIGPGVAFSEAHTVLRDWAERLWQVRVAAGGDLVKRAAIKVIYVQTIGRMAHRPGRGSEARDWYRPDWQAAIVAEWTRRTTVRALTFGPQLVGMQIDLLMVTSDSPDPLTVGLADRADGLGGYKPVLSCQIDERVIQASRGATAAAFLDTLKVDRALAGAA